MLNGLISLFGIILTILFVVGVHEFGHFFTARLLGIKVLRFSIGFGKALWHGYDKKGTEYVLAAIPLGGYVKILNEDEGVVPKEELHLAFNRQPFYKKFLVVIAGPIANLVLAFFLYWLLLIIGFTSIVPVIGNTLPGSIAFKAGVPKHQEIVSIDQRSTTSWVSVIIQILSHTGERDRLPIETKKLNSLEKPKTYLLDLTTWHMDDLKPDPLYSLGIIPYTPHIPAIIGKIFPHTPAALYFKTGDQVLLVNQKAVKDWEDLIIIIDKHPEEKLFFTIKRAGKIEHFIATTDYKRDILFKKHGFLGISPSFQWPKNLLHENKYGPITALSHAWQNTYDFTYLNFLILVKLLSGKISLQSLGGPISIFQSAGSAVHQGIAPFLSFIAFLSIAIGIINVLPIPGLDGGHILFQLIEVITRRPIPPRVLALCYRLGIIALLVLASQAIVNDLLRLK